jgi:acyl carrier protein
MTVKEVLRVKKMPENGYEAIKNKVHVFIVESFLFGDTTRIIQEDDSFLQEGIIDSTGILELIEYVEAEFGIAVSSEETIPQNMDGLARIARFIVKKQLAKGSARSVSGTQGPTRPSLIRRTSAGAH